MWFSLARTSERTAPVRSRSNTFHPRFDALEDRCLLTAGALDTNFGSGGIVTLNAGFPLTNGLGDEGVRVIVQPNGRMIVGNRFNYGWELRRFNSDGTSLDSTFGSGGIA